MTSRAMRRVEPWAAATSSAVRPDQARASGGRGETTTLRQALARRASPSRQAKCSSVKPCSWTASTCNAHG